jgi:hypothetical protein
VGLTRKIGLVDPWDLIDFNFPGIKEVRAKDAQLASRQVNWYLAEYVGCEKSTDSFNLAFSSRLTRGRGVHKGVKSSFRSPGRSKYQPCRAGPLISPRKAKLRFLRWSSSKSVRACQLELVASIRWSWRSPNRFTKIAWSTTTFSSATASEGVEIRSPSLLSGGQRWIVILNVGPAAYADPAYSKKSVLIHELAHAWQSQHHPKPWQSMLNCSECNAAAAVATRVDAASRNKWVKIATGMPDIGTGEASSYAYVPGQPFEEYAGEQIAEQVEDLFFPPRGLETAKRTLLWKIWTHISSVQAGTPDWGNIESLSKVRFEYHT